MYAVAAVLFGGVLTVVSRLRIAEERGRRRAARALPDGAIIGPRNAWVTANMCHRLTRYISSHDAGFDSVKRTDGR